jgi:hypothetical protein
VSGNGISGPAGEFKGSHFERTREHCPLAISLLVAAQWLIKILYAGGSKQTFKLREACLASATPSRAVGYGDLLQLWDRYEAAIPCRQFISAQEPNPVAYRTIQLQERDAVGEVIQHQNTQRHISESFQGAATVAQRLAVPR